MKVDNSIKLLLSVFCALLSVKVMTAQDINKKYEEVIRNNDIIYLLQGKERRADVFWKQLESSHIRLLSFQSDLNSRKKLAVQAEKDVVRYQSLVDGQTEYMFLLTDKVFDDYTNELARRLLGSLRFRMDLSFIGGESPNAFCTPSGKVYIFVGTLDYINYDENMMLGICAHEAAHYFLQHATLQRWAELNMERKNSVVAGVAVALNAAADVSSAYTSGYYGTSYESHFDRTLRTILSSTDNSNRLFHFKYSRWEEIEADLIAYRFLEFVGIDPDCYIKALASIGNDGEDFYSDWSDHPTISYRIDFLKYLRKYHPLMFDTLDRVVLSNYTGKGYCRYLDMGLYVGGFENGLKHGYGMVEFDNGAIFKGEYRLDRPNGKGSLFFEDGEGFEGDFSDGQYSFGTYYYPTGERYVGEFVNNQSSGKGVYYWTDGRIYTGQWSHDNCNGYGTLSYSNGDKYEGRFKNGAISGKGTMYYSNGDRYVGHWIDGEKTGKGTFYFSDGSKQKEVWENGVQKSCSERK